MSSAQPASEPRRRAAVFGATSAIAEAVMRLWAARGWDLFLVARDATRLREIAQDLRVRGAFRVETFVRDLDDTAEHAGLVGAIEAASGGLDVALVAHGLLGEPERAEADFAHARQILATNLVSPASLLTELARPMRARGRGTLCVVGSVAGDRGRAANFPYGAAKAGIAEFASGLRQRLLASGVRVVTIKPGPIRSPMTRHLRAGLLWSTPEAVAPAIDRAIARGVATAYVPARWRPIMWIIRHLPEPLFRRIKS